MQGFLTKLNDRPLFLQLVFVVLLIVFFMSVVAMLFALLAMVIFDLKMVEVATSMATMEFKLSNLWFTKMMQVVYTIFAFLVPAAIFVWLTQRDGSAFLRLKQKSSIYVYLLCVPIIFFAYPVIALLMEWNQSLDLPELLKTSEEDAELLTKAFLDMPSIFDLFTNLLMIAALPAIAEELLFRGVFQNMMIKKEMNPHLAIFFAAALFSAVHMQFAGFLPRMMIGALLGYLYLWSNNLWVPIFAHFVNNAMQVIMVYFMGMESFEQAENQSEFPWTVTAGFLFALLFTLSVFRKRALVNVKPIGHE